MSPNKCYMASSGAAVLTNQYFACGNSTGGGAVACCAAGDYCYQDNICHYTHDSTNGVGSGYYTAGCTDPTWQDPACHQQCISQYSGEIIYDTSNQLWLCCSVTNTTKDCRNPVLDVPAVAAPMPSALSLIRQINTPMPTPLSTSIVGQIVTSQPISAPTSSSASQTSSAPTSTQSASQSNSGGGSGVKVGIAIAVIFIVVGLGGLVVYLLARRRKRLDTQRKLFILQQQELQQQQQAAAEAEYRAHFAPPSPSHPTYYPHEPGLEYHQEMEEYYDPETNTHYTAHYNDGATKPPTNHYRSPTPTGVELPTDDFYSAAKPRDPFLTPASSTHFDQHHVPELPSSEEMIASRMPKELDSGAAGAAGYYALDKKDRTMFTDAKELHGSAGVETDRGELDAGGDGDAGRLKPKKKEGEKEEEISELEETRRRTIRYEKEGDGGWI